MLLGIDLFAVLLRNKYTLTKEGLMYHYFERSQWRSGDDLEGFWGVLRDQTLPGSAESES